MHHFEVALNDALGQWAWEEPAKVTFEVTISPNPGGIKEYRVILTS
jgi:hypothetical protein